MTLFKNQRGQGLLELVVAIGVISVGLFSAWGLFLSNFSGEQEANANIVAVNLAREGAEIVKNIRDSNWLAIENNASCSHGSAGVDSPCRWDSGLVGPNNDGTAKIADLFSGNAYLDYGVDNLSDGGAMLYIHDDGAFSHDPSGGEQTTYRRIVVLWDICCADVSDGAGGEGDYQCDDFSAGFAVEDVCSAGQLKVGIDVQSKVSWTVKGKERNLVVRDQLYNWK